MVEKSSAFSMFSCWLFHRVMSINLLIFVAEFDRN